MTTATQKKLNFDNFLERCPEKGIYELVNGEIIEVRATRNHNDVANFILFSFNDEVRRLNLNLVITNTAVIRTVTKDGIEQGRNPDVSAIDRTIWRSNRSDYNAL